MDVLTAIYLLAVGLCFTEGTIIYFVLRLRQNSRRLEQEFIPTQFEHMKEYLNSLDWSAVGAAAWERMKTGLEGTYGAAIKDLDKRGGMAMGDGVTAALDELDAPPYIKGLYVYLEKASGGKVSKALFKAARRIPVLGSAFGEADQQENQNFQG